MQLRYHPVTAFVLVFLFGVMAIGLLLGVLSVLAEPLWEQVRRSGFLMYLPFILTFFAAQQAFKGNGPPFVHFLHDDLDVLRARFRDGHLSWTIVFGLTATLITFMIACVLWLFGLSGSPLGNPFMIAVALVINLVSCFKGIQYGLAPQKAFEPNADTVKANPAALAAWGIRHMQKNMNQNNPTSASKT